MPIYKYKALSKNGFKKSGSLLACDYKCAYDMLLEKQVQPIEIKTVRLASRKVSVEDLLMFFLHLDFQLKCGVTINKAIESFMDFYGNRILKASLVEVLKVLHSGETISRSFEKCNKVFDSVIIGLLKSAEKTGKMSDIIENIISFLNLQAEWKNNVKRAIAYPIFTVIIAIFVLILSISLLGPQISSLIESFENIEIPMLTKFTINILPELSETIYCFLAINIVLLPFMASFKIGRDFLTRFAMRIPKIGSLITKICFWQFCKILSIALKAKLDFLEALDLAIGAAKINEIKRSLLIVKNYIVDGYGIFDSFSKIKFVPSNVIMAIFIGEESNKLSESFDHVSDVQHKEILFDIKALGQCLSVGLTMFTGSIFIFILCSLFYPIYKFIEVAGT